MAAAAFATSFLGRLGDAAIKANHLNEALERTGSAMSALTDQANAFNALQRSTGATTAEAARADVMFKALGLSGRDAAAAANQLRQRLGEDAFAMQAFGRSLADPRLGGMQDNMSLLLEAMDILGRIGNEELRLQRARQLGLEALLPMLDIGPEARANMEAVARLQEGVMGREYIQTMADLNANWASLTTVVLGPVNAGLNTVLNYLLAIASTAGTLPRAEREHARAMEEHAGALRASSRGIYGGGARAQAAIPAGVRAEALDNALRSQAWQFGNMVP